jgi:hypothetical protein
MFLAVRAFDVIILHELYYSGAQICYTVRDLGLC